MTAAPVFDPQRFLDSLLHRPREIEGLSAVLSHNGVNLYPRPTSEDDALSQLPVDRLYDLPDFVEVCGARSKLMAQALGDPFLVFEGRLAKQFAQHLRLTFDANREVPRPSGIASTLDVYVQQADGTWRVLDEDDDDVEALVASGAVYDDIYYAYEETPGDTVVLQRWLIAYESSRFPGFTLLGNKRDGYYTEKTLHALREQELERRRKEQRVYDAFNALKFPDLRSTGPDAPLENRRRQQFLTQAYFNTLDEHFASNKEAWSETTTEAESVKETHAFSAGGIADDAYRYFSLRYTAGEPIEALRHDLTEVVEAYEQHHKALAACEEVPHTSPLALDELSDFQRAMQIMGLCVLLHRPDLLKRIAAMIDPAYKGEDTLYEDILAFYEEGRIELDEWYHDEPYTPLVQAIYEDDEEETVRMLGDYCNRWYPAFKEKYWHGSHLWIEDVTVEYFGYWAFEAGAVAYLCNIDDSKIDHLIYPKDLVAWARANKHLEHITP